MEKTVTKHIRDHILTNKMSYESLSKSEWSPMFEKLMRNRLIVGAFRYGPLHYPDKEPWDRMGRVIRCVEEYKKTGNLEHLVDGANMFLLEFEEGTHPRRHFKASDDGEHTRIDR